jgi:hypothetical protein
VTGAELCAVDGRIAAHVIAIPLSPAEHLYETHDAAMWIAAMVRLGAMLYPTDDKKERK